MLEKSIIYLYVKLVCSHSLHSYVTNYHVTTLDLWNFSLAVHVHVHVTVYQTNKHRQTSCMRSINTVASCRPDVIHGNKLKTLC